MLQILIGNARYKCSCVRYVTSEDSEYFWLIVGLSVGFGVLLIIIIITIIVGVVVACRKRRTREDRTAFSNSGAVSTQYQPEDTQRHAMRGAEAHDAATEHPRPPNYDDEFPYLSLEKQGKH